MFFFRIVVANQHAAVKYVASENVPPLLSHTFPNTPARGQEEQILLQVPLICISAFHLLF
jgi:hypothetical protein